MLLYVGSGSDNRLKAFKRRDAIIERNLLAFVTTLLTFFIWLALNFKFILLIDGKPVVKFKII